MKNLIIPALGFALLAAVGNALFAFGQKKITLSKNPFLFLIGALTICISLFLLSTIFFKRINLKEYISLNWKWMVISGFGFFLTFIGFYFLYTKYGTSYYILYAVLSIISTSILLGFIIFKEKFNIYFALSIVFALLTILFFTLGKYKN